jgi:sugar transferase (PEP-CTERM/EpsH1 system associated)
VFVSEAETALFLKSAPEAAGRTLAVSNGVAADFFSPEHDLQNPYAIGMQAVVFTGAMDYWPNIDAAIWFATEVWPRVRAARPAAHFYIVGMNPSAAVRTLENVSGVTVTGTVPDVRPYLKHAKAVVAPLRVARGVQNKILEAMAMSRPVVASTTCVEGIGARVGAELLTAESADNFVAAVIRLLSDGEGEAIGARARQRVLDDYSWDAHLIRFDELIEASVETGRPPDACAAILEAPL